MSKDSVSKFARYGAFAVQQESTQYRLYINDYENGSPAGDALSYHSEKPFTTNDRDNDDSSDSNCASLNSSGFWYSDCSQASPLGLQS